MQQFRFTETGIDGLKIVQPFIAEDNRGYFMKFYEKEVFIENGIYISSFEENQSSSKKGVLRGLHFQTENSQSKLVRVVSGSVFDVAVDLRPNSKTFGQWRGYNISKENKKMLYIPENFAHGFLTLSDEAEVSYICGDKYSPKYDSGILWNDADINVKWPIQDGMELLISAKDSMLQNFKQYCEKIF